MQKGKYILLEGGEGLGKDYQASLLVPWLIDRGYEVMETKEPGGTFESDQIREILLKKQNNLDPLTELFLYEAARRDLNQKIIIPSVEQGKIVISKRGFPSTHAYQGFGGSTNIEIIDKLNRIAMRNLIPDLIFIFDGDPEKGLKKETNPDRFAAKGLEYHNRVREGYLDFAKRYSNISQIIPYQEGKPELMQIQMRDILKNKLKL